MTEPTTEGFDLEDLSKINDVVKKYNKTKRKYNYDTF